MEREQRQGRGFSSCYVKPQKISPGEGGEFRSVVLNHRQFCPAGDFWPGLGTLLIVMTREVGCAIDFQWVEARDVAKHFRMHSIAPTTKNYPPQSQ